MSGPPHDSLFRRLFSDRAIAADAIRSALPGEVAALLDLSSLELRPTAHVDESLHGFQSDLVFAARIAGRNALVLVLLEHQSRPDPRMPFRLLQYAMMAWDAYLRDHPATARLPLIVPIVLHQGPGTWRAPRDLLEMIDLTDEEAVVLGRYVPRMGFELDDLGATGDDALLGRSVGPAARLALSALRDVRSASDVPALLARWGGLLREARSSPSGARAAATVVRYILEVHTSLDLDEIAQLAESVDTGTGAEIMTTAQQLIDMGKVQGRRATLRHQLRLKFRDAITAAVLERLESADEARLGEIEERILTATSVDEVLG